MNRELQARRSLRLIGERRLTNFLRAVRDDDCFAIKLINDALDEGKSLESELFTGDEFGFSLTVTGRGPAFLIEFGCLAAPMAGDRGEWVVKFNADDSVKSVEAGAQWIS